MNDAPSRSSFILFWLSFVCLLLLFLFVFGEGFFQ